MSDRCEIFLCHFCGKDWWVSDGRAYGIRCSCGRALVPAFAAASWPAPERGDRCVWLEPWKNPIQLWARCACGWSRTVSIINGWTIALDHASRCAVVAHRIQRAKVRT